MNREQDYIQLCVEKIIQQTDWGSPQTWPHNNFVKLSEKIFEETNISISPSSLRRLLGKDKTPNQDYNPQSETKNALAQYLGYQDWNEFKKENGRDDEDSSNEQIKKAIKPELFFAIIGVLVILISGYFIYQSQQGYSTKDIIIDIGPTSSKEIPHTVFVKYSIPKNAEDIWVNFQSNKSDNEKAKIKYLLNPLDSFLTFTYSRKGYFIAKVTNSKGYEKDFFISLNTEGWEGFIEQFDNRYRFDVNNDRLHGKLLFPDDILLKYNIDTTKVFRTYYRNFLQQRINGDDFSFISRVQSENIVNLIKCHHLQYDLRFEEGNIFMTLTQNGCEKNANMLIQNVGLEGTETDLSGLAMDFEELNDINIQNKEKTIILTVNGEEKYRWEHGKDMGQFKGIRLEYLGKFDVDTLYFE